jgi:hypothetical protein
VSLKLSRWVICPSHAQELLPTAKVPRSLVAVVPIYISVEIVVINKRNDLRKDILAFVHGTKSRKPVDLNSNRLEAKHNLTPYLIMFSKNNLKPQRNASDLPYLLWP